MQTTYVFDTQPLVRPKLHYFKSFFILIISGLTLNLQAFDVTEKLRAGQHINVGTVQIYDDEDNINIKYKTQGDWFLGATHVNLSIGGICVNGEEITTDDGRPAPGQYTFQSTHDPMVQEVTHSYPKNLLEICNSDNSELYVLTHAEVNLLELDTGEVTQDETGFGGNQENTGKGWWYHTKVGDDGGPTPNDDFSNILGSVYFDINKDGQEDEGEPGIAGITVHLMKDGEVIATTTTDENGNYIFENLAHGDYTVLVDPDGSLSGLSPTSAQSVQVALGEDDAVVDFGYELPEITGVAFFDIIEDGVQGTDELGLEGVQVTLSDASGNVIATTTTDANGSYSFEVLPGDYAVTFTTPDGMNATTSVSTTVSVGYGDEEVNAGFALDEISLCGQTADGFTIGFWKNNMKKAIQGKKKGIQVDSDTLDSYVSLLSDYGLEPLNITSKQEAYDIMSSNSSHEDDLLAKQLMGSELNFMNEAYISGNATLTDLFLYQGEFILKYSLDFTREEILEAKDWYDMYNNSHGGEIIGINCP